MSQYCKANRLFASGLLFVLGAGAWLVTVIVPGPSSLAATNCTFLPALMAVLICAGADHDKILPAAPARIMLANNLALALVAVLLNGDGIWREAALFLVACVVIMGCVVLHEGWKERREAAPPEESSGERCEAPQLETQLAA